MSVEILDDFINEIKKHTIKELAAKSGVHENTIYNWTKRKEIPTLINAQKVANAMDMEFLLFEKE